MRVVRRGDRGPAVTEIRGILVGLGLIVGTHAGSEFESSDFDEITEHAVRTFQQSRGLSVDGAVGAETWRALGTLVTARACTCR